MSEFRFRPGARVRVKTYAPPTHTRTPYYCRGAAGEVERQCGAWRNPELLAYGHPAEHKVNLYRVRFRQRDLWPDYAGGEADVVEIELYEHWLEAEEGT